MAETVSMLRRGRGGEGRGGGGWGKGWGLDDQGRDLSRGTLPDQVLEPCPRNDDRLSSCPLTVPIHIPGAIGANQAAQLLEIAAGCPRDSAPPAAQGGEVENQRETERKCVRGAAPRHRMPGRSHEQHLVDPDTGDAAADAQRPIEDRRIAAGKGESPVGGGIDGRAWRRGTKPYQQHGEPRPAKRTEARQANHEAEGGDATKLERLRPAR